MTILMTGGSKCGKSSYAERLAQTLAGETARVHYVATMQVVDEEDLGIVRRHRRARDGKGFLVTERARDMGGLCVPNNTVLLFEDVPNLLANEMFGGAGAQGALDGLAQLARQYCHAVLITNEVGCDGADYLTDTRRYIDALGSINQALARAADCVVEMVCGLPVIWKGALPCSCCGR